MAFEGTKAFEEAEERCAEAEKLSPELKFNPDRPWEWDPWAFLFRLLEQKLR